MLFKTTVDSIIKDFSRTAERLTSYADEQHAAAERLRNEADVAHSEGTRADAIAHKLKDILS